jgi:hypothetical protein
MKPPVTRQGVFLMFFVVMALGGAAGSLLIGERVWTSQASPWTSSAAAATPALSKPPAGVSPEQLATPEFGRPATDRNEGAERVPFTMVLRPTDEAAGDEVVMQGTVHAPEGVGPDQSITMLVYYDGTRPESRWIDDLGLVRPPPRPAEVTASDIVYFIGQEDGGEWGFEVDLIQEQDKAIDSRGERGTQRAGKQTSPRRGPKGKGSGKSSALPTATPDLYMAADKLQPAGTEAAFKVTMEEPEAAEDAAPPPDKDLYSHGCDEPFGGPVLDGERPAAARGHHTAYHDK